MDKQDFTERIFSCQSPKTPAEDIRSAVAGLRRLAAAEPVNDSALSFKLLCLSDTLERMAHHIAELRPLATALESGVDRGL